MARIPIPPPRVPVVDQAGRITPPWFSFFAQFVQSVVTGAETTALDALTSTTPTTVLAGLSRRLDDLEQLAGLPVSVSPASAALEPRLRALELDPPRDRGSEIAALSARLTALEQQLALLVEPAADLNVLRRAVNDILIELTGLD